MSAMGKESELKKLNLRSVSDTKLNIDPDTIPTLIPNTTLADWMDGDEDPYYKIQSIKYPVKANGYNYLESFFESYIAKLNKRPIPGSKDGHQMEWGKRGNTDLLVIGGKLEAKGNGKGTAFLKMYIPPEGNETFIKENRSGMVDYSIVAMTRDEVIKSPKGIEINIIESITGERNDAVSHGVGAMEQKTNELDEADKNSQNDKEVKNMEKKEALELLRNLLDSGNISKTNVAEELGIPMVQEKHTNALKFEADMIDLLGENPSDRVIELQDEVKKNADGQIEARMITEFGAAKMEDGTENLLRTNADSLFKMFPEGKTLDEKINEIKENSITKKLAAEKADSTSKTNEIGVLDSTGKVSTEQSGNMKL